MDINEDGHVQFTEFIEWIFDTGWKATSDPFREPLWPSQIQRCFESEHPCSGEIGVAEDHPNLNHIHAPMPPWSPSDH